MYAAFWCIPYREAFRSHFIIFFPIVLLIYRKLPLYKVLFNQSGMMQGGGPQGEDRLPGEHALLRAAPGRGQEACRLRRLLLHTGQSLDADLKFWPCSFLPDTRCHRGQNRKHVQHSTTVSGVAGCFIPYGTLHSFFSCIYKFICFIKLSFGTRL